MATADTASPPDAAPATDAMVLPPDAPPAAKSTQWELAIEGGDESVAIVDRAGDVLAVTPSGRIVRTLATRPTSEAWFSDHLLTFRRGSELHMVNLLEPTAVEVTVATGLPPSVPWDLQRGDPLPPSVAPIDASPGVVLHYGEAPSIAVIAEGADASGSKGLPPSTLAALRSAHPSLTAEGVEFLKRYPKVHGSGFPSRATDPGKDISLSADTSSRLLPRSARRLECRSVCGRTYDLPASWPLQLLVVGTDYDCALSGLYPACVWRDPSTGRFASMARPDKLARDAVALPCKVLFDATQTAYAFDAVPSRHAALHRKVCTATGCRELGRFLGWLGPVPGMDRVPDEGEGDCDGLLH